MSKIQLLLLGHFDCLLSSGERIVFSMRKAEVLLAYLALAPGIRHPRERLINLLWSDRSEEQARNSLRQCLSAIKKSLGDAADQILHVDRTTVSLRPALIEVDALEFERLATEGDFESLSTASSLYSGELLEGISIRDTACQEWLDSERVRFKRQFIEILANLGETQLISHDFANAIKTTERLVEQDPLGESGWRLLMRSYQGHSDRSHALMAFRRCSEVLQKELGVEPEAETSELQQQIISGQIESGQPAVAENQPDSARDTTEPTSREHSILVLPFKNLSDDPEQQYFSDGLTEGIIMGLSLFPSLRVHSRHSSFAASDQNLSVREIGEKFDSLYVVEGSVRKTADQVRISAQLVDTQTGEQIWGQRFDNEIEDAFTVEDQVTQSIVAIIKGRIDFTDQEVAYRKPAKDMQSYDLLMRGIFHFVRFNPEDNRIGLELMQKCLHGDPENATAHYWMYRFYILDWISAWTSPRSESLSKSGYHISKTIEIEPGNSIFQASYAEYLLFINEFEQAMTYADRALKLNPNDTETMATISAIQACLGNVQTALDMADACRRLDPYHPWVDWVTGIAYYRGRKYEDALRAFRNMPNPADEIDGWMAACYQRLGEHDKASSQLNSYLETAHKNMAKFPESLEEWKQIWSSAASFRHQKDVDYPFEALCEAGLADFIGTQGKPVEIEDSHNIAVLPFDNLSGDPEQEYFSDGISESIILHLSRFPGLKVKSRNSSFTFKQQIKSLGEISKELEVDYIVEGSIRKSNQRIRITVQLIEAASGNQVWGKRYDAEIDDLFDLEEELSRSIAATVTGQIESDLQRIALSKGASDQQAYDLLLSGIYYFQQFTRQETVIAIDKLNQCLELDPDNLRAHVVIYEAHAMDYLERWTTDYKASFRQGERHIRRALELDPDSGLTQAFYGEFLTFAGEPDKAAVHIDRALAINPNDTDALTVKAVNLQTRCQFEEALQVAERALALDPYHPWAEWEVAGSQYLSGRYEDALETISKFRTSPGFLLVYSIASNIKLGRVDAARQGLQELLREGRESMLSMPQTIEEWYEYTRENYRLVDPQINRDLVDCLVEAGLGEADSRAAGSTESEVHSIAVLPFDNLSNDPDQEYFSDGITDSIILNLSLFPGLNVKSRNASFAFKQQIKELGEISRELGVDYLVEGSIRKSGDQVRINVQLIEAASGNQVWGKRYDAVIENLFELEAELSRTVAVTITGQIESDLERIAIAKGASNQTAYDLLLSGNYHCNKMTRDDMAISIEKLNRCLELDPDNYRAYSGLFDCHMMNAIERWVQDHETSFKQAGVCAQKAFALAPENGHALASLAEFLTFSRKPQEALEHIKKALQLNPNDAIALAEKAFALNMMGQHSKALKHAELAFQLDPYFLGAAWNLSESQVLSGRYEEALHTTADARRDPELLDIYSVVANVKLGRVEPARQALKKYIENCHRNMVSIPKSRDEWLEYSKTHTPLLDTSLNEDIVECLIEAGLEEELAKLTPTESIDQQPSILVLPFENMSGDPEQEYFSDGISESVIQNLSSFSGLKVRSRHTSFAFKDSPLSIDEIARELDLQYIVDGSVRKRGEQIRIAVQLGDTASGNQIWGKRFDTPLDDLFAFEEELVRTIAGTISGKIDREVKSSSIRKPTKNLRSYDYFMRGWYHGERFTPEDSFTALDQFNRCLEIDPENVDAHTMIASIHNVLLYENWTGDRQKTKYAAKRHISKALKLAPNHAPAHAFMSEYLLFERDYKKAMFHASKAIELNPAFPDGYSYKAFILSVTGNVDQAVEIANISMQIDPYHYYMGWNAGEVYRNAGQYDRAVEAFQTIPVLPTSLLAEMAACQIALGETDKARVTMASYRKVAQEQMPGFPSTIDAWRSLWYENQHYESEKDLDVFFDQLLQAGLCDDIGDDASEMPSILVLPLENMSGDPEQDYFSNGITSSIILGLGMYKDLTVKSRQSSFAFRDSGKPSEEIAQDLAVDYLVEGSIRKSGKRIRVSVQLIDAESGSQIWGKQYNEQLDDIFELEQDLSRTIAATISGRIGDTIQQSAV